MSIKSFKENISKRLYWLILSKNILHGEEKECVSWYLLVYSGSAHYIVFDYEMEHWDVPTMPLRHQIIAITARPLDFQRSIQPFPWQITSPNFCIITTINCGSNGPNLPSYCLGVQTAHWSRLLSLLRWTTKTNRHLINFTAIEDGEL